MNAWLVLNTAQCAAKGPTHLPRGCCARIQTVPNPCTKPDCARAARAGLGALQRYTFMLARVDLSSADRGAERCFLPCVPTLTITQLSSAASTVCQTPPASQWREELGKDQLHGRVLTGFCCLVLAVSQQLKNVHLHFGFPHPLGRAVDAVLGQGDGEPLPSAALHGVIQDGSCGSKGIGSS